MAKGNSQKEEFGKRIESEARNTHVVTNDDLVCRDCIYATVDTDSCELYLERKPNQIYYGGECEDFESQ